MKQTASPGDLSIGIDIFPALSLCLFHARSFRYIMIFLLYIAERVGFIEHILCASYRLDSEFMTQVNPYTSSVK